MDDSGPPVADGFWDPAKYIPLDGADIDFLEEVMKDAGEVKRYVDKRLDLQKPYTRGVSLYREITEKALENEWNA